VFVFGAQLEVVLMHVQIHTLIWYWWMAFQHSVMICRSFNNSFIPALYLELQPSTSTCRFLLFVPWLTVWRLLS
jgi:hypothetical protein